MVLQGLPVDGLMRSHLWGPAWLLRLITLADRLLALLVEDRVGVVGAAFCGVDCRCASRLCFCSLNAVSNRAEQPTVVHV